MLDADGDDYEIAAMELAAKEIIVADEPTDWPPLRLAIVSDSAPNTTPSETADAEETFASVAWNVPRAATWSRDDLPYADTALPEALSHDEQPVLIVEDDIPAPQPPVRREEYRNLFSRLRSG